jgi:hypothetical protein
VGVKLEAVTGLVVRVDIVASQAWKRDVADWRCGTVTLGWVVWLRADIGVCWDRDAASG